MISVIIPLYNCEKFITRSISSVLKQTVQEFEIIVVDDGSTDKGPEIVEKMNSPLIRLIHQKNQGVSCARNRGIKESRYELIAFLDADDEWDTDHLETIMYLYNKYPQCGVFAASYRMSVGNNIIYPEFNPEIPFKDDGILYNYYEVASGTNLPINSNTYVVRKNIIESIGGYPTGIPSGEDILTIARLNAVCDFAYTTKATSTYYLHNETVKSERPVLRHDPLDKLFYENYKASKHKKGARLFLASWHKRRMSRALTLRKYGIATEHFFKALTIMPFQKKLYTSFIISLISAITGKSILELNNLLKHK